MWLAHSRTRTLTLSRSELANLDDPSWFDPQVDVWTSDAHPWDEMNPALRKFEKYPS